MLSFCLQWQTSQRALCLCNPLKRQLFLWWSVPSCSLTDKSSVPSPAACGCLCRGSHPREHLCFCPSPALGTLQAGEQLHQPFCWPVALVLLPHSCSYWLICKELIKEHWLTRPETVLPRSTANGIIDKRTPSPMCAL